MAKFAIIFALSSMFLFVTISLFPLFLVCLSTPIFLFYTFFDLVVVVVVLLTLFLIGICESVIWNRAVCLGDGIWNADNVFTYFFLFRFSFVHCHLTPSLLMKFLVLTAENQDCYI